MVTFSFLMKARRMVEGDKGDLSENIVREFKRDRSVKEGDSQGLEGC